MAGNHYKGIFVWILIIQTMDIRNIIKERGFTMEQVAENIGISRVTLYQNLSRNPTVSTLQKVADVIGCEMADFFPRKENKDAGLVCPVCGARLELKVRE